MTDYFGLAVKSLPWTVVHMLFFWGAGMLAGIQLSGLTFTGGGFVIFYIATFSYLRSLTP